MPYPVKADEFQNDRDLLEQDFGLFFGPQASLYSVDAWKRDPQLMANDIALAMDAQPTLITTANAGIPALLTTVVSSKVVEVLTSKNKAEEIFGSQQFGNWEMDTLLFPVVESTGYVSGYGDFEESGRADVNVDFENRQQFRFQVITEYGELEADRFALAKMNLVERKDIAAARTLDKFMNESGFYGIAGLQNFGALNDPSLSAAVTPTVKANGGVAWGVGGAPNASPTEILFDIQKLLNVVVTASNGNVDAESAFILAMHPSSQVFLSTPNSFGQTAMKLLKDSFPKMEIKTAVEYLNGGVYSMQLIAKDVQGTEVGYMSYSYKMKAHGPVKGLSSWRQKKSAGTWGTVFLQPYAVASMTGI